MKLQRAVTSSQRVVKTFQVSISPPSEIESLTSEASPTTHTHLFKIIEIKILSKSNNIKKIDESISGYVIEFREGKIDYADKLISFANSNPQKIRLLPKSKIMYVTISKEKIKKIIELKDFLNLISRFQNESQSEIR